MKKFLFYLLVAFIEVIVLTTLTIYFFFAHEINGKISILNRENKGVILLDRNGRIFYTFYSPRIIQELPLKDIPIFFQHAVLSSEDKDFYHHPGFSIRGILRALFYNTLKKEYVYGGSTITQQLVKNALLTPEKSLLRKYEEIVLSSELERRFSKQEILEMYMNSVYFGEGAYGISNASKVYFNKKPKELTPAESALLVGLLPAPTNNDPVLHGMGQARKHQIIILTNMQQDGYLTPSQLNAIRAQEIHLRPTVLVNQDYGIHFALMVRDSLVQKYGETYLANSGFIVKTTLDSDLQQYVQQVVSRQVELLSGDHVSNAAVVVLDPKNGEIRAMVGSVDWNNPHFGKVNMAVTPRQPGSSFKPLVYAAAFEKNLITPASILEDIPTTFEGNYKPHDYDLKYRGPVTVRRALANSLNIPAVAVMQKVGVTPILQAASAFGITSLGEDPSKYGLSLVLGSGEVSLLELTNVYATFADKGTVHSPSSVSEIRNKYNQPVYISKSSAFTAVSSQVSFLISSILSDNQARAEEFGNALTISRSAAVKTGTSEDYKNALTIGYTPSITVGVWVGNNDASPMDNIAGSLGAAPIWKQVMEKSLAHSPLESFIPPKNITTELICRSRGLKIETATSSAYKEFFISGTEPTKLCMEPIPAISGVSLLPSTSSASLQ